MPRKKKQEVKVNSTASLEGLLQETYNDACLQITEAQVGINELANAATPNDVDDYTKIAKEKSNFLKVKDSAIRIKLELAKVQSDLIKNSGAVNQLANTEQQQQGEANFDDFSAIRDMLKKSGDNSDLDIE
jgi:hypothetical protein